MQNMPEEELMNREAVLAAEVERLLPEFVNSCRDRADVVIIHQDAFAADYQDHEYGKGDKVRATPRKGSPHHREEQGNAQRIEQTRIDSIKE